jgi:hypothetical protein
MEQKTMNMISTGAFLNEMDTSEKQNNVVKKLVGAWEKKNTKVARAGGVSLMALSLAACGSDDATTTSTSTSTTTTTTTTPAVTAKTITLTTGIDAGVGTSADDTISGARSDTIQTWNSGDTIAAGDGTDALSAVITANVAPAAGAITGVEDISVSNINATGATDLTVTFSTATVTGISGVTNVTNLGSSDGITFARLVDLASVTINNTDDATTVTYADSVLAGTADSMTLNVNGATGTVNIGNATSGAGTGIETLTINANGALSQFSAVNLDASATTVTVTGAAALDINAAAAFASVGTFDSSASTGDVDVTFLADGVTGTTNTKTITMGSGADALDISNIAAATIGALSASTGAGNDSVVLGAQGATDYTVDGGDGTDTLSISGDTAAITHRGVTNFEALTVTTAIGAGATNTINMALLPGTNTFTSLYANVTTGDNDGDGTETASFTNVDSSVTTLKLGALDTNDLNVSLARVVDGTADALTVAPQVASAQGTLGVADEESLTFNTADGAFTASTGITATDATSITVTGDNNAALGTVTGAKVATVDASGLTAAATFAGVFSSSTVAMTVTGQTATTYTGSVTVTTGSANDSITGSNGGDTITGGAGNDTISGGAGADTITGGTGADTITGGGGVDIFTFATDSGTDTITDFTANSTNSSDDTIAINILAGANAAAAVHELSGAETLDDGDVAVLAGNAMIDVSGNAAADLTAIKAGGGNALTLDASKQGLFIFKADTDGDGTADEVQVYLLNSLTTNTVIDTATHLATLSGYSTTADLASDFATGDFDF